ncbi:MAG: hypothetical protein GWN99_02780 [Gemmatimonadetes bacterium]|uniref:Uncharacterized protein n=1 Tax=Candidatus Kutchimonas denitrificans TaxID=3056748 RepID=A0AAE5CBV1_9BACT|nr:hypothetical protein [Gemmatimonadota bacterium]NIR74880.1 hypothetical protein [Candidatus Kutchimonas denitrificans]NIR99991.1 hypothetical protein [Gemmatimonadota bacterium]NIT65575.1 hypothetical protein [Gemmatimonadota bacterium]NIU52545.1 hypothetical protein [Gemmatimonadota bacterium]
MVPGPYINAEGNMGRINISRVILGGLLAGLIIDVGETVASLIFSAQMEEVLQALGLVMPGGGTIAVFMVLGFVMGIALVWLYAAIRPRLGAGPGTAIIAGLFFWFVGYFMPLLGDSLMGMLPWGTTAIFWIWGLVEVCLAALAGGWVYREEGAAAERPAAPAM